MEKFRTLLLDANAVPNWQRALIDTAIHPAQDLLKNVRSHKGAWGNLARKVFFPYDQLGYVMDWREAFQEHPRIDANICNINDRFSLRFALKHIAEFDLIIIMHSAAGDDMSIMLSIVEALRNRRGKLVMFIGNEYDLMAQKFLLIEQAAVDIVCSMLPTASARWLYGNRGKTQVHPMPQALNPTVYYPRAEVKRDIALGFVGSFYYPFIGDEERNKMLRTFMEWSPKAEAKVDIRIGNIPRLEWAQFLVRCVSVVGAESGTFYLDRNGEILARAKTYWQQNPNISFDDLVAKFFSGQLPEHVTGKHITSRHFEAMGSMACQVLLEGAYNGIILPQEHYISLKRDYSNFAEVKRQVMDPQHCERIARRAYELVMDAHTYRHRVESLLEAL